MTRNHLPDVVVIGTGAYRSNVRRLELAAMPTPDPIRGLGQSSKDTNAVLHVTCWLHAPLSARGRVMERPKR
jgi:hypothetical protein